MFWTIIWWVAAAGLVMSLLTKALNAIARKLEWR